MLTKRTQSFSIGVALLMISAIVVKLIGVCYKIPLMHLLGAQGMGYFNTAYDVYALLCIISTTGMPVAVSVVMNQNEGQHKRVFRLSLFIFLILGSLGAIAVFCGADKIAYAIGAPKAAQSLRFIAPAILFISLCGAYRGYYQAKCNMMPTAVSQIIEAACKLIFGLTLARIAIIAHHPPQTIAAFAVLGLCIGTALCLLYLVLCKKREPETTARPAPYNTILLTICKIAFPVTLGAVLSGASKTIDLALIMRRLQYAGISQQDAVSLYGCYSAMVIPLFGAIPALFASLAMPIVPHLSNAIRQNDLAKQTQILKSAFRLSAVISIPSAIGIGILSKPILCILFGATQDTQRAFPLLLMISMAIPASCMITTTGAVLQAYGKAWTPMIATAIGCAAKAILLYVLAAQPQIGISAAPISTLVCCCITVCINLIGIGKPVPAFGFLRIWMTSILCAAASIGTAALVLGRITALIGSDLLFSLVCVGISVPIYFILAQALGLIKISDIKTLRKKDT